MQRKIDTIREMETEKMSLLGVHVHSYIYNGHLVNAEEVVKLSQDIDPK